MSDNKDGQSGNEINIVTTDGPVKSISDCIVKCYKLATNGEQMGVTLKMAKDYQSACWCEKGFTGLKANTNYAACRIYETGDSQVYCKKYLTVIHTFWMIHVTCIQ